MKKIMITGSQNVDMLSRILNELIKHTKADYSIRRLNTSTLELVIENKKDNESFVVVNIDTPLNHYNQASQYKLITLGFNGKASVTLSSIETDLERDRTLIYCIQKEIKNKDTAIEPQEFPIKIKASWGNNVYQILSAVTAVLLVDRSIMGKLYDSNTIEQKTMQPLSRSY